MEEHDSFPVPDPTKLTTDAVNQAVAQSRRELEAVKDQLCQRMNGMDKLESEKLVHIADKFRVIERLRIEQKYDVKAAVDAALAAQKEAIGKSEGATKEQIAALGTNAETAQQSLRRDIDDLKSRVTIVEATKVGGQERRAGMTTTMTLVLQIAAILVAAMAIIVTVIIANQAG